MGEIPQKKYHISDDGKVYRVNEDGSFTEMGNIEDSFSDKKSIDVGNSGLKNKESTNTSNFKNTVVTRKKIGWILLLILLVGAGIGIFIFLNNSSIHNDNSGIDSIYPTLSTPDNATVVECAEETAQEVTVVECAEEAAQEVTKVECAEEAPQKTNSDVAQGGGTILTCPPNLKRKPLKRQR